MIVIYVPSNAAVGTAKTEFYDALHSSVTNVSTQNTLIVGNWNMRFGTL